MSALTIYKNHLSKKGKVYSSGSNTLKGEDSYKGRVIVTRKGVYLLGIIGLKNGENGENLLVEFVKMVK